MLDFPNSPTVGQTFTSAGTSWQWDGTKWVSLGGSAAYVLRSGDTMSGLLTLSGPPTTNLHAATKLYVDTADALRLPLTGGVLSGPGNLALGGATIPSPVTAPILAGVYQILTAAGTMLLLSNIYFDTVNWRAPQTGGSSYIQINPQNLLFFTAPSVAAGAIPSPALALSVSPNGNVVLGSASLPSPAPQAPALCGFQFVSLNGSSAQFAHNLYYDGTNWRLALAGIGSTLQIANGGLNFYNTPSGAAGSVPALTSRLGIDTAGDLTTSGFININPPSGQAILQMFGNTTLARDGSWTYIYDPSQSVAIYLGVSTDGRNIFANAQHYFYSRGNGTVYVQFAANGTFNVSGVWVAFSDIRTKTDVEDYTAGLDAICALRPVTYRRNGRAELPVLERKHLGFVAHEVEAIMPEIVLHEMARLDPEDEELTELLATESHNVIYAMVNAIRELRDQLAELKAAA